MRIKCTPIKDFSELKLDDLIIINAERVRYKNVFYVGYAENTGYNIIIKGICIDKKGQWYKRQTMTFSLVSLMKDCKNGHVDVYLVHDSASKHVLNTINQFKPIQNLNFIKDILYIQHG